MHGLTKIILRIIGLLALGTLLLIFVVFVTGLLLVRNTNIDLIRDPVASGDTITYSDRRTGETVRLPVFEFEALRSDSIPGAVKDVFLNVWDTKFYTHEHSLGELPFAIAMDCNIGGSWCYDPDITLKVAHNYLVLRKRTTPSKMQECVLAFRLRRQLSKDQILTHYLNTVYFGQGIFGVEAASRHFLGKNASDLQVCEAALLVSLSIDWLTSGVPNLERDYRDADYMRSRRNDILDRLSRTGLITEAKAAAYKKRPLGLVVPLDEQVGGG